jgi:hypothetical protein
MSTTQEGISTTVDDDKQKEKSAKNNENEKKDGHVETSNSDCDYNEDKSVNVTKREVTKSLPKFHSTMIAYVVPPKEHQ